MKTRSFFVFITLLMLACNLTTAQPTVQASPSTPTASSNSEEFLQVPTDSPSPSTPASETRGAGLDGCPVFPADNIWNARVDQLPIHPMSDTYIDSISLDGDEYLHPDFGSGVWPPESTSPIGIPF
nr:hypothetical protein [Anaerolineales bacterium]